jgi:uncharacterized PurR-regulated membrane protein YhhQ (DUF165 family)
MAPAGVFMAGLRFVLRDIVQERFGGHSAIAAIFAGAALSAFLAPPALVLASAGNEHNPPDRHRDAPARLHQAAAGVGLRRST